MAGASVHPPAEVLLSKRVQEMELNGEQPPAPYVSRYDYDATEDDSSTVSEIPIIDLGILSSSEASTEEYEEELMKLKSALQSWGCFQVWTRTLHLLYIFCCYQRYFYYPVSDIKEIRNMSILSVVYPFLFLWIQEKQNGEITKIQKSYLSIKEKSESKINFLNHEIITFSGIVIRG